MEGASPPLTNAANSSVISRTDLSQTLFLGSSQRDSNTSTKGTACLKRNEWQYFDSAWCFNCSDGTDEHDED
jgi:hypothetical protein